MNDTAPQVVTSYLRQLDDSLVGVPQSVREGILAGVREELTGLDAPTAALRIEELGDPAFIAAEARAGLAADPVEEQPTGEWMPVLAALLVAFGGIVVPLVGWVAGVAMVWFSRAWRTSEKLIATLAGPAVMVVIVVVLLVVQALNPPIVSPTGLQLSPLVPAPYDVLWSSLIVVAAVNAAAGLWLLWRLRRNRPTGASVAAVPSTSGYAVVTGLVIAFGGFVVSVAGWVAGIVMMWFSRTWSQWEKWVVSVTPLAAAFLANLVLWFVALAQGSPGESSIEVYGIPVVFGGASPLTVAMVAIAATVFSGFWLLFRARRVPRPQP